MEKIRFGLGSIKKCRNSSVEAIIEREIKMEIIKDLLIFVKEHLKKGVNKKCVESLIKAGVFSEFEQTRATLLASFEQIIDAIQSEKKEF